MNRFLTALLLALLLGTGTGLAAAGDDEADDSGASAKPAAASAKPASLGVAALAGEDFAKAFDKVRALLAPYLAEKAEKKEKKRISRRRHSEDEDGDGDENQEAGAGGGAQKMASAIEAAKAASVPAKAASFKSLFLACASQGLAGLRQVESGSRKSAAEGRRKLKLCADDVEAMALAAGEQGGGQAATDAKRPKNIGVNLMLGGYQDYVAGSLGLSVGIPMGKMLENGGGINLGFTNQANSGGGNNFMFNIGLDGYSHVNFYNAFGTPNIVPYVGGHATLNLGLGFGYTYDGTSSSDQTSYSLALGPQAGLLIFMSKDVALNLGLGLDYSVLGNNTDNYDSSGNATSNSSSNNGMQLVANLGLRFSL
jgi:hypothetical protein